jgi:hypothetical protein
MVKNCCHLKMKELFFKYCVAQTSMTSEFTKIAKRLFFNRGSDFNIPTLRRTHVKQLQNYTHTSLSAFDPIQGPIYIVDLVEHN